MSTNENVPDELLAVLNSPEFDDEAGILIENVRFIKESGVLVFSINYSDEGSRQLWQVTIDGIKEERIMRTWSESLSIYNSHPLLLEYLDTYTELYFKGETDEWKNLFIDIYKGITVLSENKGDVSQYLFSPDKIKEISQYGHGLFARGPKTILKIYESCLAKYNIHAYYVGERESSNEDKQLQLLKIGESFIIGKVFSFERQKDL
jgi:hypothetical protein